MKKKKVIGFVSKYFLTEDILSFTYELDMKRFPTIGESFVHFLFIKCYNSSHECFGRQDFPSKDSYKCLSVHGRDQILLQVFILPT